MNAGKDLKLELVRIVRAGFKARLKDVNVFTSDPRVKEDFPCVGVNRVYDSEDDGSLANFYDQELTPDEKATFERFSGLFTQTCELRIWTENADVRDELYVLLKEILLLAKKELGVLGFGKMVMKGGRDENDFRTYAPLTIYWGVYNFSALAPMDAWEAPDMSAPAIAAVDVTKAIDGIEQSQADLAALP
jgi:hypothetical protein